MTFAAAMFLLVLTPGPGVLTLAGVGAAFGRAAGLRFMLGLWFGHNLVSALVISGLAAVLLADPLLRAVLAVLSIGYLCYLAFRIAFAGARIAFVTRARAPGLAGGVALQAINPKAYAVNTALFSGFAFLPEDPAGEIALKVMIMNAIWVVMHGAWLWAGIALNRLDLAPRTQRIINLAMAGTMLLVVALAIGAQMRA
nr:LysE family transporter [Oceaniglobus trochenteri]